MPYHFTPADDEIAQASGQASPLWHLHLWPHRSLPPQGFVTFISVTAVLMLVPLLAVLGSPVLWGLLPFVVGTIWLIWYFLKRNYRDGELREVLTLWPERVELLRTTPRKPDQCWQANPYWVRVEIHAKGGPVPDYITLSGAGRAVELGAFLSPEERQSLFTELTDRLHRMDINAAHQSRH